MSRHRHFRPLNNLRAASTARVLNLLSISEQHADDPLYTEKPFFKAPALNTAILLKHRLRRDETYLFESARSLALKVILPFSAHDLRLGGKSFFFNQRGFMDCIEEVVRESEQDLDRDLRVLQLLDDLPSLDPFLLRETFKANRIDIATCYYQISEPERRKMQDFVSANIRDLVIRAIGQTGELSNVGLDRISNALLASDDDSRLDPFRLTLKLDSDEFRQGMFSWRGMLYYKWCSDGLWPEIERVLNELVTLQVSGAASREDRDLLRRYQKSVVTSIKRAQLDVIATLATYDIAYQELVQNGQPMKFQKFLLDAPTMFKELGEKFGALNHIASFWRYRFPRTSLLRSDIEETLSIFGDFESCFGEQANSQAKFFS